MYNITIAQIVAPFIFAGFLYNDIHTKKKHRQEIPFGKLNFPAIKNVHQVPLTNQTEMIYLTRVIERVF